MARIDLDASVGGGSYKHPFYASDITITVDVAARTLRVEATLADIPSFRWNPDGCRWEWYEDGAWTWKGKAS